MPAIRPISDLRTQAREIARLCHTSNRPVFITRNGERDLVVMSQTHYNCLVARLELYHRLEEAEHQVRRGRKTLGHQEVMRKLRAPLG